MNRSNPSSPAASKPDLTADIVVAVGAKCLYLVTRVGLPPLILTQLSLAEYGIWAISFVVVSYLGLAATGFSTVFVRRSASHREQPDATILGRMLSTGLTLLCPAAIALFGALWLAAPLLLDLLNVPAELRETARLVMLGTSAVFLADLSLGAYGYVLQGLGRLRTQQRIWVASYLLELVLIVALLWAGVGIIGLLLAFLARYAFAIVAAAWSLHRAVPGVRVRLGVLDRDVFAELKGFGVAIQLSALCATALHSIDRLIAGAMLGPQAAALFDLAGKLPTTAASIPSTVSGVTLPWAAARAANPSAVFSLYEKTTRIVGLMLLLPMPFLALFAPAVMLLWLGPRAELEILSAVMSLVAVSVHLHILTGPGSAVFRGAGNARNEFLYHGLRGALIAIAVAVSVSAADLSPLPIAVGLCIGQSTAALAYLAWNHHQMSGTLKGLGKHVLIPTLAAYPAAAITWALLGSEAGETRLDALQHLSEAGLLYALLALPVVWLLVLDANERDRITQRIATLPPFRNHEVAK